MILIRQNEHKGTWIWSSFIITLCVLIAAFGLVAVIVRTYQRHIIDQERNLTLDTPLASHTGPRFGQNGGYNQTQGGHFGMLQYGSSLN